jgi:hypothetical protein
VNSTRVELPEWGCVVAVVDGHLHFAPLPDTGDEALIPVDLVCRHFLAAVNGALATDFDPLEFPFVWCEGHDTLKRLP